MSDLTDADFEAALEARGLTPDAADREGALAIARYLDRCTRLLREAEGADAGAEARDDRD
ncbi:hypothetical protein [Wenxinia marina]|uniref:Uncharacterized protein n=1 Tax=Wenxinia marina DSM 24838 TaxID=1123501 RepID=A0A0D0Q5R0_9RHOB|nr:hypothetical protein [Wenxinia marina]KIQ69809.1 hypothetical protein Wenmar_01379 [Wenxinia marina DSM 24838]GGL61395.1 hypothetical protein GCM10011392_14810 [Wenxinia marina]